MRTNSIITVQNIVLEINNFKLHHNIRFIITFKFKTNEILSLFFPYSTSGGRIRYNKSHFESQLILFTTAYKNKPSYLVKMLNTSLSNQHSIFLR